MENLKEQYVIIADELNIRTTPDLDSEIVNTYKKGEVLNVEEIISIDNALRVKTDEGWTTLFHNKVGFFLDKITNLESDKISKEINNKLEEIELTIKEKANKINKLVKDPKKVLLRCNDVKEFLKGKYPNGVNISSLPDAVTKCMRYVAHMKKVSGADKKKLVIDAISLLLDETDSGCFEFMDPIIKDMLPNMIDTIVNVERKKIKINKKLNTSCMGCCTAYV